MSNMASDAKACFSSKAEYHAVIWYLYLKGKTGKEIHSELAQIHESPAPSYARVIILGRGCPLDATNAEMYKKVWDLMYSDRRI